MSLPYHSRMVNPRLGSYFGIFLSAFACLALLSLIFENLGWPLTATRALMLFGPILLFTGIGLASTTQVQLDYFASGRRVPAFYTGLGLAMSALGATGLLGLTGAFFLIGFDALCLSIGGLAGFVVMAILLAPFLRKFGAYTLPSYLGRRFDSRIVRLTAAALLSVPMTLILAAELRMGAYALSWLTDWPAPVLIAALTCALIISLAGGGVRSLTWSGTAQGLACLIAILVPVTIVAIVLTNIPIPQMSYGPEMRSIARYEARLGMPIVLPPALAFDLPGEGLLPLQKRFADVMGNVGSVAFVLAILSTMAGVASAPWLLPRVAATPGVYEARKSLGWATVIFGLVMMTIAPVAVFMRTYIIDVFFAPGRPRVPDWITQLTASNAASVEQTGANLQLLDFLFSRDAVLFSLPVAAGMPEAAIQLVAAGACAVALTAAGASLVALGNIFAEDIAHGLRWQPPAEATRLMMARIGLAAAALLGAIAALGTTADPFEMLLWALALSGSTLFPVLLLSIWWKRLNAFGAFGGLITGFSVCLLAILSGESGWLGIDGALGSAFGIPAGFAAAIPISLITPPPSRHVFELVRDIRVPGGEILYDRELRELKRKSIQRG